MLNPLARILLRTLGGMSNADITKAARVLRKSPKPNVQFPGSGSIVPEGQTNLFSKSGKLRDFSKPSIARTRPATLTPVQGGGRAQLLPGPIRPQAPGQMSVFGTNPNATVTAADLRTAPSIPGAGSGTRITPAQFFSQQSRMNAATARALRASWLGENITPTRLGGAATILSLADVVQDVILQRYFPETYELKQANKINGTDPTMSTTREDLRDTKATLTRARATDPTPEEVRSLTEPGGIFYLGPTSQSTKQVTPEASLTKTTDNSPVPPSRPEVDTNPPAPKPNPPAPKPTTPVTPAVPKESAYGTSGKELYMKSKGQNPFMKRYFGDDYATQSKRKLK